MSKSLLVKLSLLAVACVAAAGVFLLARPGDTRSVQAPASTTVPEIAPETVEGDAQALEDITAHDSLVVVRDVTETTVVLEDGTEADAVKDFTLPDGSVIDGEGPDDSSDADQPVEKLPATPSRDRIEEVKRDVAWPSPPTVNGSVTYLGQSWNIVDVPEDGVLIVSRVHDWHFAPGDLDQALAIVRALDGSGWSGLESSYDSARQSFKIQSSTVPGCGALGNVLCTIRVYVKSGAVELTQSYEA